MAVRLSALRTSQNFFSASGTHLCWRLSKLHGLVRLEELPKLNKIIYLIGFRTGDLPACSIIPQQLPVILVKLISICHLKLLFSCPIIIYNCRINVNVLPEPISTEQKIFSLSKTK
jgi:hypothetical protein